MVLYFGCQACLSDSMVIYVEELPARPPNCHGKSSSSVEVGGVLLHGEVGYLVFEQRQEAYLVDPVDEFLPALDAGRVVPVQPPA